MKMSIKYNITQFLFYKLGFKEKIENVLKSEPGEMNFGRHLELLKLQR